MFNVKFEENNILIPYLPAVIEAVPDYLNNPSLEFIEKYTKPTQLADTKPHVEKPSQIKPEACSWQVVEASWYGDPNRVLDPFHGLTAADGSTFNTWENTVAHKTLPFGTQLLIRSGDGSTTVRATVTDRGPFIAGREFDLSYNLANSALVETADSKTNLLAVGVGYIEICVLDE